MERKRGKVLKPWEIYPSQWMGSGPCLIQITYLKMYRPGKWISGALSRNREPPGSHACMHAHKLRILTEMTASVCFGTCTGEWVHDRRSRTDQRPRSVEQSWGTSTCRCEIFHNDFQMTTRRNKSHHKGGGGQKEERKRQDLWIPFLAGNTLGMQDKNTLGVWETGEGTGLVLSFPRRTLVLPPVREPCTGSRNLGSHLLGESLGVFVAIINVW